MRCTGILEGYISMAEFIGTEPDDKDFKLLSQFAAEVPTGPCISLAICMLLLMAAKQQKGPTAGTYMCRRATHLRTPSAEGVQRRCSLST